MLATEITELTEMNLDLRKMAVFTPSPLMGEGWGEGETLAQAFVSSHILTPSPQPSPARGEGAKSRLCLSPVDKTSAKPSMISVAMP